LQNMLMEKINGLFRRNQELRTQWKYAVDFTYCVVVLKRVYKVLRCSTELPLTEVMAQL